MIDIEIGRIDAVSLLAVSGGLVGERALSTLTSVLDEIPASDDLVVDLSLLYAIDDRAAVRFTHAVAARSANSETVVVSPHEDVSVRLVINDLDRSAPMVHTREQALDVLRARAGMALAGD